MKIELILEILSYEFMIRAIIVGGIVSICAALLGVVLVLKRYSLIGHGLADVGFASLSVAMASGLSPFYISMPMIVASSFIIMYISQNKKINGDVAIGIFSTGALSIGIAITAMTRGFNMDVYAYMFGSVLSMNQTDVKVSIGLSLLVLLMFVVFYNRIFLITADESFARAIGIKVSFYQFLISLLTALTVALGMRLMGTLLISSLIIFPAVISKKLVQSFKGMVIVSAMVSVFCFVLGLIFSFLYNIPTGASIVLVNILLVLVASIMGRVFRCHKI